MTVKIKHLAHSIWMACILLAACHSAPKPKAPTPNVTTSTIVKQDVPIYINTIGQVIPTVTVNIRPQVSGKLIAAYIRQGAIVDEGEVLYTIDPRPYQAILDEAKAQLEHDLALLTYAKQTVNRYKTIVDDEFISVLTYEQYLSNEAAARAQVELDKAAIRAAQINLDFCSVVAPVSGKISYFAVDVGNVMIIDDPNAITVIRPFSPIDISFSLPQQQLEMIRQVQGDAGEWQFVASLPEHPAEVFEGTTYFIDNQIDQNTGTILLKGRLPNNQRKLWPGAFIKVKVLHKVALNAFVVPPGAVLMGKEGSYLYIVDGENRARPFDVNVLVRTDDYIAFEAAGLKEGDTVITDGQINIAPGVIVNAKHVAR